MARKTLLSFPLHHFLLMPVLVALSARSFAEAVNALFNFFVNVQMQQQKICLALEKLLPSARAGSSGNG